MWGRWGEGGPCVKFREDLVEIVPSCIFTILAQKDMVGGGGGGIRTHIIASFMHPTRVIPF